MLFTLYVLETGKTSKMIEFASLIQGNEMWGVINDIHRENIKSKELCTECLGKVSKVNKNELLLNIGEIFEAHHLYVVIDELGLKNACTGNRVYKYVTKS